MKLSNVLPAIPSSPAVSLEEEQEGNLVVRTGKESKETWALI